MKKEQDNNIIDYNKIYNEIYHKVMNQLNETQNDQNLNALLDPEIKNEVQTINQKCEYCLFNDINITLTENDVNKYFLMKITGKTKVAKLCEFNTSKNEFAFVLSDGVVYITDEKGKTTWNDIFIVQKLEHFPNIDLTENTKYGDIFITKNGQKLKYVYKLSALNNIEFIYVFTDDNKMYNFNRYGEYEAYNNGINLYVKYEENNTNNNLLDISTDIIKQANDNLNDLMKQFNHNKQNTYITNNNNYNKKYNHTQYKETPQEKVEHIKQIIDKLDNEYNGDIRDKVTIKNEDTAVDIIKELPLKMDSIYINEEDLSIIYVKSISPSKITKEVEILTDTYMFNSEEEYVLYKNEYYTYDFSDLSKNYTIEQLKLYREISKEEVNNVINNIKIMHDNINEIKKQFKNLLKNLIFINKNY
jgi:PHD/YefM family antitoxin component YafN of YafNO toxin-antitoxin module